MGQKHVPGTIWDIGCRDCLDKADPNNDDPSRFKNIAFYDDPENVRLIRNRDTPPVFLDAAGLVEAAAGHLTAHAQGQPRFDLRAIHFVMGMHGPDAGMAALEAGLDMLGEEPGCAWTHELID